MKQTAKDQAKVPERLRALYAPIAEELQQSEEVLRGELRSDYPFVDRLAQHGFRLGGKRLRPALVLLSAAACGKPTADHPNLAAAVELIHTATLIHDDVLDEATLRRHLDTVNARWDNEASVLLGDYLFARSMRMVSMLDDSYGSRAIGEAAQRMCEGELRQVASRGNYNLTEEQYVEIISGKTAALTACCCRVGAHYAGADPEVCQAMAQYGDDLGVAFQIADDLLDVLGDEATAGKSLGTDLLKQKATLPLIRLLGTADGPDREQILRCLAGSDNHHREALRPWFEKSDAIAYAKEKAQWFATRAADQLAVLPAGEACDALRGLTEFVVKRNQ